MLGIANGTRNSQSMVLMSRTVRSSVRVRQPIYVAFTLTLWTVPTWTPDQLIVAVVLTSYRLIGPLLKEARFRRIYGSAFDAYTRVVPYWFPWPRK